MKHILVASPIASACEALAACFSAGYKVDIAETGKACMRQFPAQHYELLFIDTMFLAEMGAAEGLAQYHAVLKHFWNVHPSVQIIVLCTHQSIRAAVEAVQAGAGNYLTYPIDRKEAHYVVQTTFDALRMQSELDYLRDQFWHADSLEIVRTNSQAMKEVFRKIRTVAPADTTVLITGETGTGKGVVANLMHQHGSRKDRQFISVHCGAIPENLLESELFGHEKGAFTGAVRRKLGRFEIAHGGTIFLDEVGTMPLSAQAKLLQVLQERVFHRVGGEDLIRCDVRVIAASNTELATMVDQGSFRKDLYYRLNVFPVELPPLRNRKEDIPLLAESFLRQLNKRYAKRIAGIHTDVLRAFAHYSWPGNIRELENLIERGYLLESGTTLMPDSFPGELMGSVKPLTELPLNTTLTLAQVRRKGLEEIERTYLKEQLTRNHGRIDKTAKAVNITTRQLHKLLTKHAIRKEQYKLRA